MVNPSEQKAPLTDCLDLQPDEPVVVLALQLLLHCFQAPHSLLQRWTSGLADVDHLLLLQVGLQTSACQSVQAEHRRQPLPSEWPGAHC
jgi:hypothetical protein